MKLLDVLKIKLIQAHNRKSQARGHEYAVKAISDAQYNFEMARQEPERLPITLTLHGEHKGTAFLIGVKSVIKEHNLDFNLALKTLKGE